MLKLETMIWKHSAQYRKKTLTADEREFAENVFRDWRNRYVAALARNIRLQCLSRRTGYPIPERVPSPEWSNAAIHVLTIPGEIVQDWFLRSPAVVKNEIVKAVIADGGIRNSSGMFIELPPL